MNDKPKRYLLDKDGNPVLSKFGHPITAKLTDDEKAEIDRLLAEGWTKKAVWERLNITTGRLSEYLKGKGVAERIALLSHTSHQANEITRLADALSLLVTMVGQLEARLSETQTGVKKLQSQTYRSRIGREKAERSARSQRKDLNALRRKLHLRTGRSI